MGSFAYGFYYNRPQGNRKGYSITWDTGCIACLTKASAVKIKKELMALGNDKDSIIIEKNEF